MGALWGTMESFRVLWIRKGPMGPIIYRNLGALNGRRGSCYGCFAARRPFNYLKTADEVHDDLLAKQRAQETCNADPCKDSYFAK